MTDASLIAANLKRVRDAVAEAEAKYDRKPGCVKILAASKTQTVETVAVAIAAGQTRFGESYVQEAQKKIAEIGDSEIEWHFIGPIQSNKTRRIASLFSWVHGVDRESIARRLSEQRPAESPRLNVCIQVNVSGEATKSGVQPGGVETLLETISAAPGLKTRLKIRGLMAIPAPDADGTRQRKAFAAVRHIFDKYAEAYEMDTLSMGMSGDFDAAIAEGATLVRLGTAIFGERKRRK